MTDKHSNGTYAIIKTGGKQYRVEKDDVIDVELIDAQHGSKIKFEDVLFFYDGKKSKVGNPHISNFFVQGEVIETVAGPKISSIKYKRSHTQVRKFGHRQKYSRIKIIGIGA